MKISWIDVLLVLLGLFIAYQLINALLGGSWQTESIIISLLIFNLGLTYRLSMKTSKLNNFDSAQKSVKDF